MNRRALLALLTVPCAVAFGAGLLRLFLWRFEVGDVYPPYSSFRTDPLGTRALYDALGGLPECTATRFLRPTRDLPRGRGTCLLLLGAAPALAGSADELRDLDGFLAEGGRVVLALDVRAVAGANLSCQRCTDGPGADGRERPPRKGPRPQPRKTADGREPLPPSPRRGADGRQPLELHATERLLQHWGLDVVPSALAGPARAEAVATLSAGDEPLPGTLPWPAAGALALPGSAWTSVYQAGTHPVVAVRRLGAGTLIAVADSYLFSNEGLRAALQAQFLSWAVGPSVRLLFDETHLGIQDRLGVMTLARRYRLHGFFAALAAWAGLYLWWCLARPLTPPPSGPADEAMAGRAATGALRDLLQRHVPREALLEHCVEAWGRTATLPVPIVKRRLARLRERVRAETAAPRRRRAAATCYRELCEICARKE